MSSNSTSPIAEMIIGDEALGDHPGVAGAAIVCDTLNRTIQYIKRFFNCCKI